MHRALVPGRFQPFHWGHLDLVKWVLDNVAEEVVIVIGTAQESHTLQNPFTAGERMLMIREALKEAGVPLEKVFIVPVPDISMNVVWPYYVSMYVPPFDVVVSRNPLVVRLFEEAGKRVVIPPVFRNGLSASDIRYRMIKGMPWKNFVPAAVARVIEEVNGDERMKKIYGEIEK